MAQRGSSSGHAPLRLAGAFLAGEFELIARHFNWPAPAGILGVGDDCALLPVSPAHQLAVTTDLLIEGCHFFSDVDPYTLGHKALAVNVSDLAAMGARPLGCVLSLSLPTADDEWLARFASGFRSFAERVGCPLVGGDTTRSPKHIVVSVTAMGEVPVDAALARSAARAGDDIWVTGSLGAPQLALSLLQGRAPEHIDLLEGLRPFLEKPMPPVAFGVALSGLAHAAIDISDGLLQDLGHILRASGCAADIYYPQLPVHPLVANLHPSIVQPAVLNGGDVYQLCFTAPPTARPSIEALAKAHGVQATLIGQIRPGQGVRVEGSPIPLGTEDYYGFNHFK